MLIRKAYNDARKYSYAEKDPAASLERTSSATSDACNMKLWSWSDVVLAMKGCLAMKGIKTDFLIRPSKAMKTDENMTLEEDVKSSRMKDTVIHLQS